MRQGEINAPKSRSDGLGSHILDRRAVLGGLAVTAVSVALPLPLPLPLPLRTLPPGLRHRHNESVRTSSWLTDAADQLALLEVVARTHRRPDQETDAVLAARNRLAGRGGSAVWPPLVGLADAAKPSPSPSSTARSYRRSHVVPIIASVRASLADARASAPLLSGDVGARLVMATGHAVPPADLLAQPSIQQVAEDCAAAYEARTPGLDSLVCSALLDIWEDRIVCEPIEEVEVLATWAAILRDRHDLGAVWVAHRANVLLQNGLGPESSRSRLLRSRAAGDAALVLRHHAYRGGAVRMAIRALEALGEPRNLEEEMHAQSMKICLAGAVAEARRLAPASWPDRSTEMLTEIAASAAGAWPLTALFQQTQVAAYLAGMSDDGRERSVHRWVTELAAERDVTDPVPGSSWDLSWSGTRTELAVRLRDADLLRSSLERLVVATEEMPHFQAELGPAARIVERHRSRSLVAAIPEDLLVAILHHGT